MLNRLMTMLTSMNKNNKKQICILCIAVFVLMVLCGGEIFGKTDEKTNEAATELLVMEEELEQRMEDFLKTVDGVGKVEVCIIFDQLAETAYATNDEIDDNEMTAEYVIIKNADGSEAGLPICIRAPQIRGVAVSCEGGASAKVRNEITALLTASLGISANRVHVSPQTVKK